MEKVTGIRGILLLFANLKAPSLNLFIRGISSSGIPPSGKITNDYVKKIYDNYASPGKIIIDGGNSFFEDSINSYNLLKIKDMHFIDCGVSGGVLGKDNGFCLMVGGDENIFYQIEPILKILATFNGYQYLGKSGSGHYAKMVHNGIEYGLLAAYAEGFNLLSKANYNYN